MSDIGYYDMTAGQRRASQENEVAANGHTAINVAALDPTTLASLDTPYVTNPDNGGFAATYLANQPNIEAAVTQGMNLMIFDRAVTNAQTALPGGSGIIVVRDFANDTAVDLAANAPGWFTNGPVGTIDDATFKGGTSLSHGYVDLATLPPGAIPLLTNGNPNQIAAFAYPYGNGNVFYSAIPLHYYSASQMTSITSAEVQALFGNPQYGMELANPICFGRQTQIAAPSGARPVESLQVGDLVVLHTLNRRALQEIAILFPDIRLSDPLCPLAPPTVLPILNRALRPGNDARP